MIVIVLLYMKIRGAGAAEGWSPARWAEGCSRGWHMWHIYSTIYIYIYIYIYDLMNPYLFRVIYLNVPKCLNVPPLEVEHP